MAAISGQWRTPIAAPSVPTLRRPPIVRPRSASGGGSQHSRRPGTRRLGHEPMTRSRILERDELDSLATGAGVLGTGGGTHPYLELLAVQCLYDQECHAELTSPDALEDDAKVAVVGLMGAPLVTKER